LEPLWAKICLPQDLLTRGLKKVFFRTRIQASVFYFPLKFITQLQKF